MTKGTHKRISQACKNGARKAKLRMSRGFREMPGITRKLLVATFGMKSNRLTAGGTWCKVKNEKENT